MADYRFVLMNAVLIIGAVMLLGPLNMAEVLDDDLVVGDAEEMLAEGEIDSLDEVDFDTQRLIFETPEDIVQEGEQGALAWNGSMNDRGDPYGYAIYNVSNINAVTIDAYTGNFFRQIEVHIDDELGSSVGRGTTTFDVSDNEKFEVRIYSTDNHYVLDVRDPDQTLGLGDFYESFAIKEIELDIEESAFDQIAASLSTSLAAIVSIPVMLFAWIDFIFIIPGFVGTAMRMYITAFVVYFLVKEIWIG